MKRINFEFELTTDELGDLRIAVEDFYPGRPAPPCSNPDHPDYSDPGDDPEFFWDAYIAGTNKMIPIDDMKLINLIEDIILDEGMKRMSAYDEDNYERRMGI